MDSIMDCGFWAGYMDHDHAAKLVDVLLDICEREIEKIGQ